MCSALCTLGTGASFEEEPRLRVQDSGLRTHESVIAVAGKHESDKIRDLVLLHDAAFNAC